jgi:hypothetical protein
MTSPAPAPLTACRSALAQGFLKSAPRSVLDEKGYVREASQNLIEGVRLDDCEADLNQGGGNEMKGKFRAAHSSSALAVNTFAPFKANPMRCDFRGAVASPACNLSGNVRTVLRVGPHQTSTSLPMVQAAWSQSSQSSWNP